MRIELVKAVRVLEIINLQRARARGAQAKILNARHTFSSDRLEETFSAQISLSLSPTQSHNPTYNSNG